jgi:hypothetical protein
MSTRRRRKLIWRSIVAKLTEQQYLLYSVRSIPCCVARWIASVLSPKQNCHSNYSMGGSNALCIPKK